MTRCAGRFTYRDFARGAPVDAGSRDRFRASFTFRQEHLAFLSSKSCWMEWRLCSRLSRSSQSLSIPVGRVQRKQMSRPRQVNRAELTRKRLWLRRVCGVSHYQEGSRTPVDPYGARKYYKDDELNKSS